MTVLAEKLKEAGIDTDSIALDGALRDALAATKGNADRAVEKLAAIMRTRPDLLRTMIRRTLTEFQNSAKADGGQADVANSGLSAGAADKSRGEGHNNSATDGQAQRAPSRDTTAQRKASLHVASVTVSAWQDVRERYGIDFRRVQWHELLKLSAKHKTLGRLCEAIHRHSPTADPFEYVHKIINDDLLRVLLNQAERSNAD